MDAIGQPVYVGDEVAYITRRCGLIYVRRRTIAEVKSPVGDTPHMVRFEDGAHCNAKACNTVKVKKL